MTERKAPTRPCPSCGKINHVRVLKCECGKVLRESQPQEQKIKTEEKTETPSVLNPHDFPGRGKTQCPSCKKYVGAKLTNCNLCNALLRPNKTEELKTPTIPVSSGKKFDGPGPGRKHCSNCNSYVGVRTIKCECGFEFNGKKDSATIESFKSFVPPSPTLKSRPSTSFGNVPAIPSFLALAKKIPKEEDKKEKTKEQVIFFNPGQGKKLCTECTKVAGRNIYVPVATRICARCNFFFEKKEKSEPFKRIEIPEILGTFVSYTKDEAASNYISLNLEYEDREYSLILEGVNLSYEEIDAELCLLDKIENLNDKHPDEVKDYLSNLFKNSISSIKWKWVLSDDVFKEENKLPSYLRFNLRNKKFNRTKAMWEHFCVTRNEYLKYNPLNVQKLNTPNYHFSGNKIVINR